MRDILKSHYKSMGKFTLVGISNTLIDFAIFTILLEVFGVHGLVAHVCGFTVAVCNSFYFNATWTFKRLDKQQFHKQAAMFFLVSVVGLGLSTLTIYVANFYIWVYFAKILATIVSFSWNYMASFLFVFKKPGSEGEP